MQLAQWLVFIGIAAFAAAGISKYMSYLKTRPKRPQSPAPRPVKEIEAEIREFEERIEDAVEKESIDFGFSQGFKFALGFWTGTILFSILIMTLFGGMIFGALNSFVQPSAQSVFMRR